MSVDGGWSINLFSAGTDFRRQNRTILDVESDDMAYAKIFQRSVLMTWEWSLSATVDVVH